MRHCGAQPLLAVTVAEVAAEVTVTEVIVADATLGARVGGECGDWAVSATRRARTIERETLRVTLTCTHEQCWVVGAVDGGAGWPLRGAKAGKW